MQRLLVGIAAGAAATELVHRTLIDQNPDAELHPSTKPSLSRHGTPSTGPDTIHYENHALHYDQARRVPLWSLERLRRAHLDGPADRRTSRFRPDDHVPKQFQSANSDFWKSGWSRGHMVPAGNCKHSQSAMDETFFLTNVVPQNIDNNSGYWNLLEMKCRQLAKETYDDVEIISGPLWIPEATDENGKRFVRYEVIGKNDVAVPTHLYKIILGRKGDRLALASFVVPNRPIDIKRPLTEFRVPLENLERIAGILFFPRLDRNSVVDLCATSEGSCDLSLKHAGWIALRSIRTARDVTSLEREWRRIDAQGFLDVVPGLEEAYAKKKREFETAER